MFNKQTKNDHSTSLFDVEVKLILNFMDFFTPQSYVLSLTYRVRVCHH